MHLCIYCTQEKKLTNLFAYSPSLLSEHMMLVCCLHARKVRTYQGDMPLREPLYWTPAVRLYSIQCTEIGIEMRIE
jgi:hypothetical protein